MPDDAPLAELADLADEPMPDALARRLAATFAALDAERAASRTKPGACAPALKSFVREGENERTTR